MLHEAVDVRLVEVDLPRIERLEEQVQTPLRNLVVQLSARDVFRSQKRRYRNGNLPVGRAGLHWAGQGPAAQAGNNRQAANNRDTTPMGGKNSRELHSVP